MGSFEVYQITGERVLVNADTVMAIREIEGDRSTCILDFVSGDSMKARPVRTEETEHDDAYDVFVERWHE